MGIKNSRNYVYNQHIKKSYYENLINDVVFIDKTYRKCKTHKEREIFYKSVLAKHKKLLKSREKKCRCYKTREYCCDNEYSNIYLIKIPTGNVYYIEVEILKNLSYCDGKIGIVTLPESYLLILNQDRHTPIHGGLYWYNNIIEYSTENGTFFHPNTRIKTDLDLSFGKGDIIGLKVSNNKRNIYIIKNGKILMMMKDLIFGKFAFFIRFDCAKINIRDYTIFKGFRNKILIPIFVVKDEEKKLCDIIIKTVI